MKNTKNTKNTEMKLSKKTLQQLAQIAMNADYSIACRGDIEAHYNDEEDYLEVSIRAIQAMLENAYRLGMEDAAKK